MASIQTDKAEVDFETMESGVLAKVFVEAGTTIDCGAPIGILVEDAADVSAFANSTASDFGDANKDESAPAVSEPSSLDSIPTADAPTTSSDSFPEHEVLGLPALSPTMETGTVAKWLKKAGDEIVAGDIICEVETDKATVDFEATDDGYLAKQLCEEGVSLDVGHPIAVIVEDGENLAAFESFTLSHAQSVEEEVEVVSLPKKQEVPEPTPVSQTPAVASTTVAATTTTTTQPITYDGDVSAQWRREVLQRSPLSYSMTASQLRYIDEFGETGMEPLSRGPSKCC